MIFESRQKGSWSPVGLGTGTLASLGRAANIKEVQALLAAMQESGLNVIDTSNTYGSGDCERLIARAIGSQREHFKLVTKAGYCHADLPDPLSRLNQIGKKLIQRLGQKQNFDPHYISNCLDRSLARLNVSKVDAFLLHDPDTEAISSQELLTRLEQIRSSGKAGAIGISASSPEVVQAAIKTGVFNIVQTPVNIKAASYLQASWKTCDESGIHIIGNHVFDPQCLKREGMNHELLMRASAALLPKTATILCGTRKPAHLQQTLKWRLNPIKKSEAFKLSHRLTV